MLCDHGRRNNRCFSERTNDFGHPIRRQRCCRSEDFLGFVQVTHLTGRALADKILGCLKRMHIDCSYLVGQGYDGAAAMSRIYNGVQALVKEKYPLATYVHCASHCLNLTIAKAASVQSIRNAQRLSTLWKVQQNNRTFSLNACLLWKTKNRRRNWDLSVRRDGWNVMMQLSYFATCILPYLIYSWVGFFCSFAGCISHKSLENNWNYKFQGCIQIHPLNL